MRILLISDMAATGFGRVGRELGTRLLGMGHDIRILGINWRGIDGELMAGIPRAGIEAQAAYLEARLAQIREDPLVDRIYPAGAHGDAMGYNLTGPAVDGQMWGGWDPEAIILVADPRAAYARLVRDGGAIGRAKARGVRTLNYVPIEGTGLPLDWQVIWGAMEPVAMSDFGGEQLEGLLGVPVPVVPHGVSDVFRPISPDDPGDWHGAPIMTRDAAKAALGFADRTIILRADRFVFRKNYPAWFRVLRPVLAKHPEAVALAHTVATDDVGQGTIWQLMSREEGAACLGVGAWMETEWAHPQFVVTGMHDSWRGLSDEGLRVLYNAADLVASTTMGEGWGLTLGESLGCGTPVVATDCSAVPQVVGPGGVLIPAIGTITNGYAHEWALVDEARMSLEVERLITRPALRRSLGNAGRLHVAQYTWAAVAERFATLLLTGGE